MAISSAFSQDRRARGLAIKTEYQAVDLSEPKGRPIKIFVPCLAQESVSVAAEPYDFVSMSDTAAKFGYKSTAYEIAEMLKPQYAIGVGSIPITFFPLAVTGTGAQAVGTITPTGTCTFSQTYIVKMNNKPSGKIDLVSGDAPAQFITKAIAAINGVLSFPAVASDGTTAVNLTVGFETDAGDFCHIEVESPSNHEMTFALVQPTGGGGTIDISTAWAVFNDNWYSHVINGVDDVTGDTVLDSAESFGTLRRSAEVHKGFRMYTGTNEATLATVTAITDARKDDETNCIKHSPGSNDLPWVIAARHAGIACPVWYADPAQDPQLRTLDLLTAGPDANQLDSDARDQAVKKGLSTIEVQDGIVKISDSVTCYHPVGEDPPGFSYEVDDEKNAGMIYSINVIFSNPADAGNPTVPDFQTTTNPNVRKGSYFKQKLDRLFAGAGLAAWISDPDYAVANTQVVPSPTNPKRFDCRIVYKISGNNSVISVDNNFTFYVG